MPTQHIKNVSQQFVSEVQDRYVAGGLACAGLETGFPKLDEMLGGLQPDAMYVVGGRPGSGKTSFALDLSLHVASQGKRVLFYSLEMSAKRLVCRLLSRMTGVPGIRIMQGRLSKSEFEAVEQASCSLSAYQVAIVDDTLDSDGLSRHAKRIAEKTTVDLLVVDYLSLLRDQQRFGEYERVTRISNTLRSLARPDQLNVPILALVQLNRESDKREDHMPTLADIRDSGAIEQDAHAVIFCYRPYYYKLLRGEPPLEEEKDAALIVAKNRDGPQGKVKAIFYPSRTQWVPYESVMGE